LVFRSSIPCPPVPLFTLRAPPHDEPRKTRGQDGSLLLSCKTLSFSTSCRFIPALGRNPIICRGPFSFCSFSAGQWIWPATSGPGEIPSLLQTPCSPPAARFGCAAGASPPPSRLPSPQAMMPNPLSEPEPEPATPILWHRSAARSAQPRCSRDNPRPYAQSGPVPDSFPRTGSRPRDVPRPGRMRKNAPATAVR
jgi:hypothetical protein